MAVENTVFTKIGNKNIIFNSGSRCLLWRTFQGTSHKTLNKNFVVALPCAFLLQEIMAVQERNNSRTFLCKILNTQKKQGFEGKRVGFCMRLFYPLLVVSLNRR